MTDPESLVRQFIADYKEWNDRSNARIERDDSPETFKAAEVDYAELLSRYCVPGTTGASIAFGAESSHDPARERIFAARTIGARSVVTTVCEDSAGFETTYEYTLVAQGDRWLIESLEHIDAEGIKTRAL